MSRMRSEGLRYKCLSLFFCDYAQRDNKTAIPTSLHWLHIKIRITTAFKSYGVKSKPICKLVQAYLDRVRSLCVSKKSQRRACIDSRMVSTSPCQTHARGIPRVNAQPFYLWYRACAVRREWPHRLACRQRGLLPRLCVCVKHLHCLEDWVSTMITLPRRFTKSSHNHLTPQTVIQKRKQTNRTNKQYKLHYGTWVNTCALRRRRCASDR